MSDRGIRMELLSFLILGIFVGILGSLLGIGGGVVIVPLLVFAWGYEPQVAIGTSVLVVLLTSISGTLALVPLVPSFLLALVNML